MELIDTHAHLDMLTAPLGEVLARAARAGVTDIVAVGESIAGSAASIELAEAHDGTDGLPAVWATVGVHPHEARHYDAAADAQLRRLAGQPRVIAIGETGLDFHHDHSPREAQAAAFAAQARIASETGLPLVVHDREAHREVYEALAPLLGEGPPRGLGAAVIHCFSGDAAWARRFAEAGCHIAVGGAVTFKRANDLREAVAAVPADCLLLETDCPYLSPEPFRGKENEPARLDLIVEAVAAAHGAGATEVAALTSRNARRFFGLTTDGAP